MSEVQTLRGKVERSFYFKGAALEAGKYYELPRLFALEMQAANKFTVGAEQAPQKPVAEPVKAEAPRRSRGEKNVS
jgi:hypothetical protein